MYIYCKLAEWLVVPCTLLVLKYEQYDCTESLLLLATCYPTCSSVADGRRSHTHLDNDC